jgi:serine/threonine-protein kinase
MRFWPSLFATTALITTIGGARPAFAEDAQAQALGRALFNDGVALFNRGEFDAACPKFEASLKHFPGVGTRGKLAECYEKIGRYASAWATYREVAQLAARNGEPVREQVARERARALEPKLAHVTVMIAPSNDLPGLVVKRAGVEIERAKLGVAEASDPGTFAVEVSAPGRKTFTTKILVKPGDSMRVDIPQLALITPTSAPFVLPTTTPPVSTTEPAPVRLQPSPLAPSIADSPSVRAWQKPLGFVLTGTGVVGLGVGAVLGLSAKSTYDDAFNGGGCDKGTKACNAAGIDAVDKAKQQATTATVFVVAGGVLGVTGIVLLLTAPKAPISALRVVPTLRVGEVGLSIGGSL